MERHFEKQLDKLKTRVIKMCSLVDEQVEFALKALDEENIEMAKLVIERDAKVDKFDLKIEKICQKIFALTQPVAMDLRLIMSSLTINTNLERIGDIAVNIAEQVLRMNKKPDFIFRIKYREMADLSKTMVRNAIDSYIGQNAELAKSVLEADDALDEYNRQNHIILKEIMKEDKENIDSAVDMLVISRHLERMGDHATNIAEDVYFIVEAQMIKHKYEELFFSSDSEDDDDS